MNWANSAFQTLFFIIGKCHTFDEAYRVALCQLQERECSVFEIEARAGRMFAELEYADHHNEEMNPIQRRDLNAIRVARREVEFLRELVRRIEPHRKFRDMDDNDAHQLAQREQWKIEFIQRAENMIYATGGVLWNELESMRLHPDYETEILPAIERIVADYEANGKPPALSGPVLNVMKQIERDTALRITDKGTIHAMYERRIA